MLVCARARWLIVDFVESSLVEWNNDDAAWELIQYYSTAAKSILAHVLKTVVLAHVLKQVC